MNSSVDGQEQKALKNQETPSFLLGLPNFILGIGFNVDEYWGLCAKPDLTNNNERLRSEGPPKPMGNTISFNLLGRNNSKKRNRFLGSHRNPKVTNPIQMTDFFNPSMNGGRFEFSSQKSSINGAKGQSHTRARLPSDNLSRITNRRSKPKADDE